MFSLGVPADTPEAARDKLLIVLFVLFSIPPSGLLAICNDFEEQRGNINASGSVVLVGEGWMEMRREGVDLWARDTSGRA